MQNQRSLNFQDHHAISLASSVMLALSSSSTEILVLTVKWLLQQYYNLCKICTNTQMRQTSVSSLETSILVETTCLETSSEVLGLLQTTLETSVDSPKNFSHQVS